MAHDCIYCGGYCDCDCDDTWLPTPHDCRGCGSDHCGRELDGFLDDDDDVIWEEPDDDSDDVMILEDR